MILKEKSRFTRLSPYAVNYAKKIHVFWYSKVSIIRPGRSRLLEFEKKIVLVV